MSIGPEVSLFHGLKCVSVVTRRSRAGSKHYISAANLDFSWHLLQHCVVFSLAYSHWLNRRNIQFKNFQRGPKTLVSALDLLNTKYVSQLRRINRIHQHRHFKKLYCKPKWFSLESLITIHKTHKIQSFSLKIQLHKVSSCSSTSTI